MPEAVTDKQNTPVSRKIQIRITDRVENQIGNVSKSLPTLMVRFASVTVLGPRRG